MRSKSLVLSAITVVLIAELCSAATIRVPEDQPTIRDGVLAAGLGDTVLVAAGTYYESDTINLGSDLVLVSETGQSDCVIIDMQHQARAFRAWGLAGTLLVQGFTVRNGGYYYSLESGGGMELTSVSDYSNTITLRDLVFEGCTAFADAGALLVTGVQSPVHLERVELRGNSAGSAGGGLYVETSPFVHLDTVTIEQNTAGTDAGGAYIDGCYGGSIANCLISGNHSEWLCGGIWLADCGDLNVADTVVDGNESGGSAGGIRVLSSYLICDRLQVTRNLSAEGGGMELGSSDCTVRSSTIANNAPSNLVTSGGDPWLHRTIVSHAASGYGILGQGGSHPTLIECDVFGNPGGDYAGSAVDQTGFNCNISADPLYCDAATGDYSIDDLSPCAPGNAPCGELIGAVSAGCSSTVVEGAVAEVSWGRLKALYR